MLGRPGKKPMNLGRPAVVAYTPQLTIISSGQDKLWKPSTNYYLYRDLGSQRSCNYKQVVNARIVNSALIETISSSIA